MQLPASGPVKQVVSDSTRLLTLRCTNLTSTNHDLGPELHSGFLKSACANANIYVVFLETSRKVPRAFIGLSKATNKSGPLIRLVRPLYSNSHVNYVVSADSFSSFFLVKI